MSSDADVFEHDVLQPLDARWVSYRRRVALIRTLVYALLFFGGGVAFSVLQDVSPWVPLAIAAVPVVILALIGWLWPSFTYRYASYRVSGDGIEIRTGALWHRRIHVPRSRIQHSDVSQGPVERRFGLGTLTLSTAGTMHSAVRLPGLEHGSALAIRAHLTQHDAHDVV